MSRSADKRNSNDSNIVNPVTARTHVCYKKLDSQRERLVKEGEKSTFLVEALEMTINAKKNNEGWQDLKDIWKEFREIEDDLKESCDAQGGREAGAEYGQWWIDRASIKMFDLEKNQEKILLLAKKAESVLDEDHDWMDKKLVEAFVGQVELLEEIASGYEGRMEDEEKMLIAENRTEDDVWKRSYEKAKWADSYELAMWLKKEAPQMNIDNVFKWSKRVNARNNLEKDHPARLNFCHYVACKIVLETRLAKISYGRIQTRAMKSLKKFLSLWETYDLSKRFNENGYVELDTNRKVDLEASYFGNILPASSWEDGIDKIREAREKASWNSVSVEEMVCIMDNDEEEKENKIYPIEEI